MSPYMHIKVMSNEEAEEAARHLAEEEARDAAEEAVRISTEEEAKIAALIAVKQYLKDLKIVRLPLK